MAENDEVVGDRYRLDRTVGSGAMGVVWRAEDERLRRTVAVKQVTVPPSADAESRDQAHRRVMREGRMIARLHHPHSIAVFDVVEHDDQPWLVMEYLPSRSLAEVLAEDGPLPPDAVARLGRQVADALTAAHEVGMVHRDIKPGNVLLGEGGVVKVTDFGIARAVDDVTITSAGMMAGTPAYLAPEVARGADADFRSDVYSLGATLYAALEGGPPFGTAENALAVLHRVATGDYIAPRRSGPLTPLLTRLLDPDPERRPEMYQIRDELGRYVSAQTPTEQGPSTPVVGHPVLSAAAANPAVSPPAAAPPRREPPPPTSPPFTPPQSTTPQSTTPQSTTQADRTTPAAAPPTPAMPPPAMSAPAMPTPAMPAHAPGGEGPPAQDDGERPRRRGRWIAVGAAVVVLIAVVVAVVVLSGTGGTSGGALLGSGGDTPSSGTTAAPGAETATPSGGTEEQRAQQQAVVDYYALLPDRLDEGWQRLTPDYQSGTAGGFDSYRRFWSAVSLVTVRSVSPAGNDSVDATVSYTYRDGREVQERTVFRMAPQDGGAWAIDGSTVQSSR